MSRTLYRPGLAILALSILLSGAARAIAQPTAKAAASTSREEKLAEAQRLIGEMRQAASAGQTSPAMAACKKLLALQKELEPENVENRAKVLAFLADLQREQDDLAAEKVTRQKILAIYEKLYGKQDWRIHDARLALYDVTLYQGLSKAQRQQLRTSQENAVLGSTRVGEGKLAEAAQLLEQSYVTRKAILGEQHRSTIDSLSYLAVVYQKSGDSAKAEPLLRRVLEARKKNLGEAHPDYAQAQHNLATLLAGKGAYDEAVELMDQSLAVRKKALGENSLEYIRALQDLATVHENQGNYARAAATYVIAVDLAKQSQGESSPLYAAMLNLMATAYHNAGQFDKVVPLYGAALEAYRKTADQDPSGYLETLDLLVRHYQDRGNLAEAVRICSQSIEIRKQVLGEEHRGYVSQLLRLSGLLQQMKELDKAELLLRQSLEITRRTQGDASRDHATILHRLGQLSVVQGKHDQALTLMKQTADILKQVQGDEDPEYAAALGTWAEECRSQGDYAQAESLGREALKVWKKGHHEKNPSFVLALLELGLIYQAQGDYAKAEPLFREAVDVRRQTVGEQHPLYADALMALARYLAALGDYLQAAKLHQQAGEIIQKVYGPQSLDYAASLKELADMYYEIRAYSKCVPLYRQIVEIRKARSGEDDLEYLAALSELAKMLADMGDVAAAEPLVQQYLARQEKLTGEASANYATVLGEAALIYFQLKNENRADELVRKSLQIQQQALGDKEIRYIRSLGRWAAHYRDRGNDARAEELFNAALEAVRNNHGEQVPAYVEILGRLGNLKKQQRDYPEAERLLKQAETIARQSADLRSSLHGDCLTNLAVLYYQMDDDVRGDDLAEQARKWTQSVSGDDVQPLAAALGNWANFHSQRGDYARSLPLWRQSVEMYKKAVGEKHLLYARALAGLAELYLSMGDARQALPLYVQSAEIVQAVEGELHPEYAVALNNIGAAYLFTEDITRGVDYLQRSHQVRRKIFGENHLGLVDSLLENAMVLQGIKAYANAEPLYRQAVDILEKHDGGPRDRQLASALHGYSKFYLDQGDFQQAERLLRRALDIDKQTGQEQDASSKVELALLCLAQGRADEATPLAYDAVRATRRKGNLTAVVQSERQQLSMARKLRSYLDTYLSAALAGKTPMEQVYQEVLAWKGAVFLQQRLQRLRSRSLAGEASQGAAVLLSKLEQKSRELASLARQTFEGEEAAAHQQRVESLSNEIEQLQAELATLDSGAGRAAPAVPRTVAELQKLLPRQTMLVDVLEFTRFAPPAAGEERPAREPHFVAFLLRPDRPLLAVELGPAKTMSSTIEKWREAVGGGASGADDPGAVLRKLLWQPLQDFAQGCTTILISPDGQLARLSWGALPGAKPGTFLLEDFAIATVPVAQSLEELLAPREDSSRQGFQLLLVGDVAFDASPGQTSQLAHGHSRVAPRGQSGASNTWKELPGTTKESAAIRALFEKSFGKSELKSLMREQATEAQVRSVAPKCRYLHLATHGFFSPAPAPDALASFVGELFESLTVAEAISSDEADSPRDEQNIGTSRMFRPERGVTGLHPGLLSGIVLAGANQEVQANRDDGVLTALEVGELDLGQVDLVTLSACETGLGESAGGEGLLGLQRAFQVAGAHSVVASLWQVPDDATRALMTEFFQNLWVKKFSKIEALRQAQLTILRQYDPRSGTLRGLTVAQPKPAARSAASLPPLYWAAFVLSGDWR